MTDAAIYLRSGSRYPYDHDGDGPARPAADWAETAARGVLSDLCDRRGIKWELESVNRADRVQLLADLAEIIRLAHAFHIGRADSPPVTAEHGAVIRELRAALQAMLDFPGGMYAPALEAKARAALDMSSASASDEASTTRARD